MPSVNSLSREVVFKIVYYGPGLGGKTTTLEYLHATAKAEHRGKLVSLATPVDRTLYFDFLPVRLPRVRGLSVRLQLFTVPGQVYFNATRRLVLTGADGIVFVSDSQEARADANVEALDNLRENLSLQGKNLDDLPLVFQHNKRDLLDVLPLDELNAMLNPRGVPAIAASARTGLGVYETLEAVSDRTLAAFESRMPDSTTPGVRGELSRIEGGLAGALRSAAVDAPPSLIARIRPPAAEWQGLGAHVALEEQDIEAFVAATAQADGTLRASARPPAVGLSFAELWAESEQDTVRELEAALVARRTRRAVELAEALVARIIASTLARMGEPDELATRPLALFALRLSGPNYYAFRTILRDARAGVDVSPLDALTAYGFAIEARLAKTQLTGKDGRS